jgi:hypothetical protein
MSCESHRARAVQFIIAAHPDKGLTAQDAERIYQQARRSPVAMKTLLPVIKQPHRKYKGRTAIFKVEGVMPDALKEQLKQFGFSYSAQESVLEIPANKWGGEAYRFMDAVWSAKTLADLGLDPAAHTAQKERERKERTREQARLRATAGDMDKLQAAVKKVEVLAHGDLAALYSRLASGLLGKPCRVKMELPTEPPGKPSPACRYEPTAGVFLADPYPLGKGAPARENLVVTRLGIERELAWLKHTPPEIIATAQAMAAGELPPEGLNERGRHMVPAAYGLIERARSERVWLGNNAGLVKGAYAARRLKPEWTGVGATLRVAPTRLRPDAPVNITGALTMLAVPFGGLSDEQWAIFSPTTQNVLKKLEPVVAQAAQGTPEDAYRAALVVARELQSAGLSLDLQPSDAARFPMLPKAIKPVNLMRRCPHCQSFLGRDGQCHNPRCPGSPVPTIASTAIAHWVRAKPARDKPEPDSAKKSKQSPVPRPAPCRLPGGQPQGERRAQAKESKPQKNEKQAETATPKKESKPQKDETQKKQPAVEPVADARAQLIAELRELEKKNAELRVKLAGQAGGHD